MKHDDEFAPKIRKRPPRQRGYDPIASAWRKQLRKRVKAARRAAKRV